MAVDPRFQAGYTDDGMVFLHFNIGSQDGTPLQGTMTMPPAEADTLARMLREAADKCVNKSAIITLRQV